MRIWRITRKKYRAEAFSGERAAMAGYRWSGVGRRAVYFASSPSLAVLEVLVHAQGSKVPKDYVIVPLDLPTSVQSQVVDIAGLPAGWQTPENVYCKEIGNAWYDAGRKLLLDVPSAVMPLERNFVMNPSHPEFEKLDTSHAGYPLQFDSRLVAILEQKSIG